MLNPLILKRGLRTHTFKNTEQYFKYAKSKELKTNSTVFSGTSFELASMSELQKCFKGLNLHHVGGTNDNGIDLSGKWNLEKYLTKNDSKIMNDKVHDEEIISILNQSIPELNVLVQCKNYSTKITAKEIRELPGIFHAEFNHINSKNSMVLFCAPNVLTKNGIQQIQSSNIPIGYCQISRLNQVKRGDLYDINNYSGGLLLNFLPNGNLEALLKGTGFFNKIDKLIQKNLS